MIDIGNVQAGRVRIYKLNTFKAFTPRENELYQQRKQDELLSEIHNNKDIRSIDEKYLNERFQISIFENDVVRLALKVRDEEINYQLLDEIVYLEVCRNHYEIMRQIIEYGIYIGENKYVFFSASTGQVRNSTITLIKQDFFEQHADALLMGLTPEYINRRGGMNVGKYLSYTALPLSSSVLPDKEINIDRCIVVKGLETTVTDEVKYIDIQQDGNGQHYVADTPSDYQTKDILIEHTDGAGMFLPGELPSSCQIRGGFFKGAMFPFDFRLFAKEVANNTVVRDAWGNQVDIEEQDIRFIFTTSQLKAWKMFNSWEDYKQAFKKNNVKLSINSYANPAKDTVNFAYQYLQTLPYGCDIKKLCEAAKDDLKRLCTDIEYVKEAMGYSDADAQDDSLSCNSVIAKALHVYPQLIYDNYITDKIQQLIRSRRKSYRAGKLPLDGYYSYAAPDMYAFCEYLFCGILAPEGLVPKNHIYNSHYDKKGVVERVICLRSPHLSGYEYGKRELVKTDECRRWFQYMETDTVTSCHDLISKTLQMDWDGDEILVSDDKELYELAKSLPDVPLYYEMQQAAAQNITTDTIFDTLVKGFDNNVIGDSSNAITKLWNTPKASKDNPTPYDDAINVFCAYSNYAIDYPKTGKSLDLGAYRALYDDLVPPKNGKERFELPKIPPPNFFIEAKGKKKKNVAEPTHSVMDEIKKYIGQGTGRFHYSYFDNPQDDKFDYRMLMNNEQREDGTAKYEVNRYDSKYQKLYLMLKDRKSAKVNLCRSIEETMRRQNTDVAERTSDFEVFHYHCIQEIKKIFTDPKGYCNIQLAVNYLIDLEYSQHEFVTSSKDILWKCFGHILLENLQNNVKGQITIKQRPRMAYIKAKNGVKELDELLTQRLEKHSVEISQSDWDFIDGALQRYKNGKTHKNDKELLYVLYCLYKDAQERNTLKDGYLIITRKKHVMDYSGGKSKGRKRRVSFNMNKILTMAQAQSYNGSLDRFKKTPGIEIVDDTEKEQYKFKFAVPTPDDILFKVGDVNNALVYLKAHETGTGTHKCVICGTDFIKHSNNQKTCSDECKAKLHKLNQAKVNERRRAAVAVGA